MDQPLTIGFWELLALTVVGGAVGGIADLLHKIEFTNNGYKADGAVVTPRDLALLVLRAAFVGMVGALGILALRAWLGDLTEYISPSTLDRALNFTISVLAGFAARTLLPTIAAKLEKEVRSQGERIEEQERELKEQERVNLRQEERLGELIGNVSDSRKRLEYQMRFSEADTTLRNMERALPSDRERAFKALNTILEENATDRLAAIWLARLYAEGEPADIDSAIATLTGFLTAKGALGEKDEDYADARYNRACYYSLLARDLEARDEGSDGVQQLVESAIADLATSVELKPTNKEDARADGDLEWLRKFDAFRTIIG